jgi:hypothetical protein
MYLQFAASQGGERKKDVSQESGGFLSGKLSITEKSSAIFTGLVSTLSIPAARHSSRTSRRAWAVMPTMQVLPPFSFSLISLV